MIKMRWIICFGVVIALVFAVFDLYQTRGEAGHDAYTYSSKEDALVAGLEQVTGDTQSISTINSWVVDKRKDGKNEYFLFAVPYMESGMEKHYAFVAMAKESGNKYAFFKMTADVALNSPGDVPDKQNSDSIVFFFDNVDGYYICVGKVYRQGVLPYANGRQLTLNQDGVFSYFGKGGRPEIDIQKP